MSEEKLNLPPQIDNMIRQMQSSIQPGHVRANYRNSLDIIRAEIEKAILKFDQGARN